MIEAELLNRSKKELFKRFYFNIFSLEIFKPYFCVNYDLIQKQLLLLIYPYQPNAYQNIHHNLYIPLMSLLSFLFFKREIKSISIFFSKTLIISFLVILIFKLLFYTNSIKFDLLNLVCFTSYRFFFALFMQHWRSIKIFFNLCILINYFYFVTRSFKQKLFYQSNVENLKIILLVLGIGEVLVLVLLSLIM